MWRKTLVLLVLALAGAVPRVINYQGKIVDSRGIDVNDTLPIVFKLYTTAEGGTPIWIDTIPEVPVRNGIFAVELEGFPDSVNFSAQYWLEVEIDGETLSPRERLVAAPYSLYSKRAESVEKAIQSIHSEENTTPRTGRMVFRAGPGATLSDSGDTITIVIGGASTSTPNLYNVLSAGNSAGGQQIKYLGDPTDAQDAVTKRYVDNASVAYASEAGHASWADWCPGGGGSCDWCNWASNADHAMWADWCGSCGGGGWCDWCNWASFADHAMWAEDINVGGSGWGMLQKNPYNWPPIQAINGSTNYITKWTDEYTIGISSIFEDATGKIGIGTTSPSYKLDVRSGDIYSSGYVRGGTGLCIGSDCRTTWPTGGGSGGGGVSGSGTANYVPLWVDSVSLGNSNIYQSSGKIGIGTSTPYAHLDIKESSSPSIPFRIINQNNATAAQIQISSSNDASMYLGNWGGATNVYLNTNGNSWFAGGNVGIGTMAPTHSLHIFGNIRIVDGNQGAGKVLVSDSLGVGRWQTLSGGGSTPDLSSVLDAGNNANGYQIKNLGSPTDPQDAATKEYVDNASVAFAYEANHANWADNAMHADDVWHAMEADHAWWADHAMHADYVWHAMEADHAWWAEDINVGGSGWGMLQKTPYNWPPIQAINGSTNYITKWTDEYTIGISSIFDDGSNIGIGTTSPAEKFHISEGNLRISSTINPAIEIENLNRNYMYRIISADDYSLDIRYKTPTSDFSRLLIDQEGKVGIGVAYPQARLDVDGPVKFRTWEARSYSGDVPGSVSCPTGKSIVFGFAIQTSTNHSGEACLRANNKACPIGGTSCSVSECDTPGDDEAFIYIVCQ